MNRWTALAVSLLAAACAVDGDDSDVDITPHGKADDLYGALVFDAELGDSFKHARLDCTRSTCDVTMQVEVDGQSALQLAKAHFAANPADTRASTRFGRCGAQWRALPISSPLSPLPTMGGGSGSSAGRLIRRS